MKAIAIGAVLALAGCGTAGTLAPRTTAGFEAHGVLGALEGASGAMLTTCRTLDGGLVRAAGDGVALATGTGGALAGIRAARRAACAAAGAVNVLSDDFTVDARAATVHRRPGDTARPRG